MSDWVCVGDDAALHRELDSGGCEYSDGLTEEDLGH